MLLQAVEKIIKIGRNMVKTGVALAVSGEDPNIHRYLPSVIGKILTPEQRKRKKVKKSVDCGLRVKLFGFLGLLGAGSVYGKVCSFYTSMVCTASFERCSFIERLIIF